MRRCKPSADAFAVFLVCAFALSAARAEESANRPLGVSGYGFADFRSAYYSRGQIVNAEPIMPMYGQLRFNGGEFGHVGASVWAVNAVSHGGQSANRRNAFHEVDLRPFYGYGLRICDGWALQNTVSRQWVVLPGYRTHPPTVHEWQLAQSLENPYLTPYYLWRHAFRGARWNIWQVGVVRTFGLDEGVRLRPRFWCDFGDPDHFGKQYSCRCHDGLMALNASLRFEWDFMDHLTFYAEIQQFDVVSASGRDALDARGYHQDCKDLTIGTVGLSVSF